MKAKYLIIIVISLLLSGLFFWKGLDDYWLHKQVLGASISQVTSQIPGMTFAHVVRVVDGDTIVVSINAQESTVRFVGINTPETVDPRRPVQCFGKKASDETKHLLSGKDVYLSKDISEKDKYNRLLRFVYLPMPDGRLLFVNDYLVRAGFAQSYPYPPDVTYAARFLEAEKEAKVKKLGLWVSCGGI